MTSTNTFQGLEDSGKPSSRVLRPPGGGSSNIFGGYEDDSSASRRPNKMASTVFAPPEAPQGGPKRSNPPGGKSSGIFTEPEAAFPQHKPLPPGGVTSNIFGGPVSNLPTVKSHPNKPKDNISVGSAVQVRAAARTRLSQLPGESEWETASPPHGQTHSTDRGWRKKKIRLKCGATRYRHRTRRPNGAQSWPRRGRCSAAEGLCA
ncbi:hypothetical protein HF521_004436 [Silurus meridionalis]|uniref:Jupiter microtubule associated homolog 2 n=1 Tax=Silurus meridionalis TaxID=175797 RepID=A0A8T0AY95_SILME|nr:hypothetical protein HF521_004436 [Silurus meridionalis]